MRLGAAEPSAGTNKQVAIGADGFHRIGDRDEAKLLAVGGKSDVGGFSTKIGRTS